MCRLLGVVCPANESDAGALDSTGSSRNQSDSVIAALGTDLDEFAALASYHCDGWGIGYSAPQREPTLVKEPGGALVGSGFATATAAAAHAHADAAIFHIRYASEGMVNQAVNTHPFVADSAQGPVVFAHNGHIYPHANLVQLHRHSGADAPHGTTDSELYFQMVVAELALADPATALLRVADRISAVTRYIGLNCLLLTNDALYALCRYDQEEIDSRDDVNTTFDMHYRADDGAGPRREVVVASSGWDQPAPLWTEIPNGQVLRIERKTARIDLRGRPLTHAEIRQAYSPNDAAALEMTEKSGNLSRFGTAS